MNCDFDLGLLQGLLEHNSFIQHIEYFPCTESTQTEARLFVQKNGVSNALFIAGSQTEGRGRFNRAWLNTPGALNFSILFRPRISLSKLPLINYAAGLAMKETVRADGIKTELKWPNDITASGKKLCGILSESATVLDSLFFVVTGIGLNVNSAAADFAAEISDIATSLKLLTGKDFSREKLIADFIPKFEKYVHLTESNPMHFMQKYKKECSTLGKEVKIIADGCEIFCIAEDINSDGSLLVNKNGERKSFFAADVVHLRNA